MCSELWVIGVVPSFQARVTISGCIFDDVNSKFRSSEIHWNVPSVGNVAKVYIAKASDAMLS